MVSTVKYIDSMGRGGEYVYPYVPTFFEAFALMI